MKSKVTVTRFLGVGAHKTGTSWLHAQLQATPQAWVPKVRKQVHFFGEYLGKGLDWYSGFFPGHPAAESYRAWGEITPKYLFDPGALERIADPLGFDVRIVVILRDPVDRFFSHCAMSYSQGDTDPGSDDFVKTNREAFERGRYAEQLRRYLHSLGRENILVLFYEELFSTDASGIPESLYEVGNFLGLDNSLWSGLASGKRIGNEGSAGRPRFVALYTLAKRIRQWCRDRDLEGWCRS
jgi:hypothetical protein